MRTMIVAIVASALTSCATVQTKLGVTKEARQEWGIREWTFWATTFLLTGYVITEWNSRPQGPGDPSGPPNCEPHIPAPADGCVR